MRIETQFQKLDMPAQRPDRRQTLKSLLSPIATPRSRQILARAARRSKFRWQTIAPPKLRKNIQSIAIASAALCALTIFPLPHPLRSIAQTIVGLLFIPFLILLWKYQDLHHHYIHRLRARCPQCGQDLRPTPHSCPTCTPPTPVP